MASTPFDINCSNIFLCLSPKAKETKVKINKWDLIKLKNFAQQRKPLTKKKKPTEWEKIFVNYMTNKETMSKIYKQLIQHSKK